MAAGLLWIRLAQGPIDLAVLARHVQETVNARIEGSRVEVGGASLSLGREGAPSGIRFTDVRVFSEDGTKLLAAPALAAGFQLSDLIRGRLQPTRLEVIGARARVVRGEDGRIRFGLGAGPGVDLGGGGPDRAATDAVARIVRGFVGDIAPVPVLERLERVGILRADLTYEDAISGRRWRTRGSDLTILRTSYGARALMEASITERAEAPVRLKVTATRRSGTERTDFRIRFDGLRPSALAAQAPALAWAGMLDAPLSGVVRVAVLPDGTIGPARGHLEAGAGLLLPAPPGHRAFDRAQVSFAAEPGFRTLRVLRFEVEGPDIEARLAGDVAVLGPVALAAEALEAQVYVERLRLDLPERFAEPLEFDGGQAIARVGLDPLEVELGHAHLTRGDLALALEGEAREGEAGWESLLRAEIRGARVADLKALWPKGLGENARLWVVENLIEGRLTEVVAQAAFAPERPPRLALDFAFADLDSRYLGDMPPIEAGRGTGHLTVDAFDLHLAEGRVGLGPAGEVALGPSRLAVRDFSGAVTPADIRISGSGPTGAILALIDREPLRLVRKLGLDLGSVRGRAEVTADLAFPLIQELEMEEIEVASEATLTGFATRLALGGAPEMAVEADRLALAATAEEMEVSGAARVDGVPLRLDWTERYAGRGSRTLDLAGRVTPALLARFGAEVPGFQGGAAEAEARIEQAGGETRLTADLDLSPAALALPEIGWEKPAGRTGRLSLSGRLGAETAFDRLALEAPGLSVAGSARLAPGGGLAEARIDRFRLDDRADLSGRLAARPEGGYRAELSGARLDLSEVLEASETEGGGGPPIRLTAEIERLILARGIEVAGAEMRLSRDADGAATAKLSGRAGGAAPFDANFTRRAGEGGKLRLRSPDAGRLLSALGFFEGGQGGSLILDAVLAPDAARDLRGEAEIREMRVLRSATFGSILEEGGAEAAAEAVQGEGILFDSIMIPFSLTDGVLDLDEAIARSPLVAVKVEGRVDAPGDRLALVGVISPAYGVTGALDEVPLLGTLLSGGEGEGIFAMTFQVGGSLADPSFEVNPLSFLAPGILRGVFKGRAGKARQGFLDQLGPTD